MEKQIIKQMLWDAGVIGAYITTWFVLIITPIVYENLIYEYGHFVMQLILTGIIIYLSYKLKKEYEEL